MSRNKHHQGRYPGPNGNNQHDYNQSQNSNHNHNHNHSYNQNNQHSQNGGPRGPNNQANHPGRNQNANYHINGGNTFQYDNDGRNQRNPHNNNVWRNNDNNSNNHDWRNQRNPHNNNGWVNNDNNNNNQDRRADRYNQNFGNNRTPKGPDRKHHQSTPPPPYNQGMYLGAGIVKAFHGSEGLSAITEDAALRFKYYKLNHELPLDREHLEQQQQQPQAQVDSDLDLLVGPEELALGQPGFTNPVPRKLHGPKCVAYGKTLLDADIDVIMCHGECEKAMLPDCVAMSFCALLAENARLRDQVTYYRSAHHLGLNPA